MKIMKTFSAAHYAVIGLATAFALAASDTAQAYQCKSTFVHAEAIANTRIQARSSARSIWSNSAKAQYGLAWSLWNIAQSKSLNCSWTGSKHWCIAKAKPCLHVVQ